MVRLFGRSLALVALLSLAPVSTRAGRLVKPAAPPNGAPTFDEQSAAARLSTAAIAAHVRFLADDLLEGRKPGTRGSSLAVKYLTAQLEALGLAPGARDAAGAPSFLQPVPLVELKAHVPPSVPFWPLSAQIVAGPGPLALSAGGGTKAELILDPDAHVDLARLDDAELVFAGYGITAPEYGWDDYKDSDVRGKIVVLLNFNPPFAGEVNGHRVRLWYGRWDYKFQAAAARGAAGALIVHTEESAGYPWKVLAASADGARLDLPPREGEPRMQFQGWVESAAAGKLAALGGQDLSKLIAGAQEKGFRPVSLGVKTRFTLPIARRSFESANVIGRLPGVDPLLRDEAVVYTAHHDHLGTVPPVPPATDGIYNGAVDNASGCATVLAIAQALALSKPRRSVLFVFTTAEEQGLLGARWFAQHPPLPPGRIAAGLNIDSVNIWGRTTDLSQLGLGKTSLDAAVAVLAAAQGRSVHGDAFADRGAFYRSDQFELARIGVPVAALRGGPGFEGHPPAWGPAQMDAWTRTDYHQVTDEFHDQWDLRGALQDAELNLMVGLRIANADAQPAWTAGDEFEAVRKKAAR